MLFFFFFTKSEEMSRVGSRDRHPRWRSNIFYQVEKKSLEFVRLSEHIRIPIFAQCSAE